MKIMKKTFNLFALATVLAFLSISSMACSGSSQPNNEGTPSMAQPAPEAAPAEPAPAPETPPAPAQ